MTIEELKTLIASGEGETLEVKETTGQRVDACETLCGFLNKDGGTLGGPGAVPAKAGKADTEVGPSLRGRKRPSKNSVLLTHDNRAIILFVTVVTNLRQRVLDNKMALDCIIDAWRKADNWLVGRFVIMPDHIHFFCAPSTYPPSNFHSWLNYWKSLSARTFPVSHNIPLWQRNCWDTQLRKGDSYAAKWKYVRNNPVRRGLVDNVDAWPYQGEMNVLEWHD
jgi:putative transposase